MVTAHAQSFSGLCWPVHQRPVDDTRQEYDELAEDDLGQPYGAVRQFRHPFRGS